MSKRSNNLGLHSEAGPLALEEAAAKECKSLHTPVVDGESRCHILFVIDQLCELGGAERVLFKMIRLLPKTLFRCSLMTFRTTSEVDLREAGCPVYVLPLRRTYDWNALKVARQIRRFVHEQRVSIVHTFFETSDLWAGPIAKLGSGVLLISSRRDLGILRAWKHRIGYKLFRGFYDSVLTVSHQVREYCIGADGLDPGRVETLFNGVDVDAVLRAKPRSRTREEMDIPESVPVIASVGNIRKVKGIDILVEAAALVCKQRPETLFLVVGGKSEEQHCQQLETRIAALGLTNNFRLLGSRKSEDVFSILRMSDIFCLPSRSEGFSNALIEAMACRLPCVATDVGGNREVLTHNETGFLVANEDVQQLAHSLLRLLADPQRAREMGVRGEEIVQERFTSQAMIRKLVDVYKKLMAARRPS